MTEAIELDSALTSINLYRGHIDHLLWLSNQI